MAKLKITCAECGSENCGRDATARWSEEDQAWELSSVFDNAWCDGCGNADVKLQEEEMEA